MANEPSAQSDLSRALEFALNLHGYSFQHAMLALAQASRSPWEAIASEFPVDLRGVTTRIDFILHSRQPPRYMVVECKRADPALSNWIFCRSPWRSGHTSAEAVLIEALATLEGQRYAVARQLTFPADLTSIALEVKSEKKGDGTGKKGTIEDVCTQVMRGHNGLIRHFLERHPPGHNEAIEFIPVVVTTAKLLTSDTDLSSTDIETGHVRITTEPLERPWIFYQYHQSPGLKHGLTHWTNRSGIHPLDSVLYSEYVRTICFVSAASFARFLAWRSWTRAAE